ncbi:MAG: type VI secretion system tip protein VgrG, partial [Paracoccaceae bacterium]|nr:type VI secretion system tip protein VgrG [Paracoccaceae bacterium]
MADDREITVSVPAFGDKVFFARLEGFDEISRPFRYELALASKDLDLKADDVLGKTATVMVTGEPKRHFNGLVSEFIVDPFRDDYAHYRLVIVPWLWFLSLRTDNRIFQNQSVVDIIEAVFGNYPDAKFEKRLKASYPPRDYCVQYGESDLDFVQRLMEHEGIFYFFEHDEGAHQMVLVDANATLEPAPGAETVPYEPDGRISFRDGDFITAWKPCSSVRPGKFVHTDYDFQKPSSDLMAKADNPLGFAQDAGENYHYPGDYLEHGRGDTLSALRLEELQAAHIRVTAEGTARPLWSGRSFKLDLFPREAENDDYIVLRAEYALWDAQYRSGQSDAQQGYGVTLHVAPKSIAFRPDRLTPQPVMRGPQTAKVVGPAGEEIFTDEFARVKVQFHWDRLGKKDENTTCFVRVSQTWAGAGWGFIQIPRIGQEVIVDFLEGDPDQPIITGRVYNAEQMPPYGLPGNATQSGWKSNSSPGGGGWNELRFEDKAGSEEVYFQAQKDHNELVKNNEARTIGNDFAEDVGHDAQQSVGHDRTESVANDKATSVGNNRTVDIGVNDTETVGSNRSLTVGADETISIGANSTETIGSNHTQSVGIAQTITVGAVRTDTVGAAENRTVGASQTMNIGASRAVTVGSGQTHRVGADDGWTVGGSQTVAVSADQAVTIGGGHTESIGKDQAWTVAGSRVAKVGKDEALEVAAKMGVKVGASFLLDVADEIAIKCGSSAITMKKDGTITIE